jgi:hypothetical protein
MEHRSTTTVSNSPYVEANNKTMDKDKVLRSRTVVPMVLDESNNATTIVYRQEDSRQERPLDSHVNTIEEETTDVSIRRQLPSRSPPNKKEKLSDPGTVDLTIPDLSESASATEEKWVLSRSLAWSQDSMDRRPPPGSPHHANLRFQRNHSMLIDSRTVSGEVSPTSTCLYWEEKLEQSVPFPEF